MLTYFFACVYSAPEFAFVNVPEASNIGWSFVNNHSVPKSANSLSRAKYQFVLVSVGACIALPRDREALFVIAPYRCVRSRTTCASEISTNRSDGTHILDFKG